jgi:ABC-2 type transport system ATP-binding protein
MRNEHNTVLEVRGLRHRYGSVNALAGVDLSVDAGQCVALLGPNGAGKTTLVKTVIGLVSAQEGTVVVDGDDPRHAATRRRMGVVQQSVGFPRTLTVAEVVRGAAHRAGVGDGTARAVIEEMGLDGLETRRAGALSGGQQQRLQLAMGLVADPALLVLDEPTEGLDASARRGFWETIERRRDNGAGVLVTTHIIEEAAAVADHVVVLDRGLVVAQGSPYELKRTLPNRFVTANTSIEPGRLLELPGVVSAQRTATGTQVVATLAEDLVRAMLDLDPELSDLTISTATLEEALIALTTERIAA